MNTDTQQAHPDSDALQRYALSPSAEEHARLRRHLLTCSACRRKTEEIMMLLEKIRQQVPQTGAHSAAVFDALEEDNAHRIALYVDGVLDEMQSREVQEWLRQDRRAMKSALHYALHSQGFPSSGTDATETPGTDPASRKKQNRGLFSRLNGWRQAWSGLGSWPFVPAVAMPAIALAVAALAYLILPGVLTDRTGTLVAAYQDNPVVYFRHAEQQIPGIGFFTAARDSQRDYGEVTVSATGAAVHMRWPAIENARHYVVSLYQVSVKNGSEQRVLLGKHTTSVTNTVFHYESEIPSLKAGRRYEWEIQGPAGKGMNFYTQGGFVLN